MLNSKNRLAKVWLELFYFHTGHFLNQSQPFTRGRGSKCLVVDPVLHLGAQPPCSLAARFASSQFLSQGFTLRTPSGSILY